jgi:hypothetical protein
VSWIAAHLQSNGELIAAPHMQHADKGFDGLHLHVDKKTSTITRAVVCEEKATENPRDTIREDVWPEFEDFETGAHDHRLVSEITQLLEMSPNLDPDTAIANVLWNKARAYRVSITISDTHNSNIGRARLFKNYEKFVGDAVIRRRAESHIDVVQRPKRGSLCQAAGYEHLSERKIRVFVEIAFKLFAKSPGLGPVLISFCLWKIDAVCSKLRNLSMPYVISTHFPDLSAANCYFSIRIPHHSHQYY